MADANGKAATIEILNGKMIVHKGSDLSFPVLTNNTYDESVRSVKNSSSNGNNSLERFGEACKMIQQLSTLKISKPLTDYAFDILGEVDQGDFTKWSIGYDITNKTIQFKTNRFKQVKTVNFSAFDFNCTAAAKVWDINQTANGAINNLFQDFNNDINKRIVETATKESESNVSINQKNRERLWQYASKIKCN